MRKQFSQACENNKGPILEVLREAFSEVERVLEVGSGTGQHAAHFAKHLPHVQWVPSDRPGRLESIQAWRADAELPNMEQPRELDLFEDGWSPGEVDAMYSANVIHVSPWEATERFFHHADELLPQGGLLFFYGPFRYEDRELEASNVGFERWLKEQDPSYGIRAFEDLQALADEREFVLEEDRAMPANNRCIWWRKV